MVITLIISAFLIFLGVLLRQGKGLMLLAGYNTMPKEKRDKIDKQWLGKVSGNLLIRMGIYTAALGFLLPHNFIILATVFALFFIADLVYTIVKLNQKVPPTSFAENKSTKAVLIIVAVSIIGTAVLLYAGKQDPTIVVQNNAISISGLYGVDIPFSTIHSITLLDTTMAEIGVGKRTNGFGGLGQTLKGNFTNSQQQPVLLFVQSQTAPTILIQQKNAPDVYISFHDSEKTTNLYHTLLQSI